MKIIDYIRECRIPMRSADKPIDLLNKSDNVEQFDLAWAFSQADHEIKRFNDNAKNYPHIVLDLIPELKDYQAKVVRWNYWESGHDNYHVLKAPWYGLKTPILKCAKALNIDKSPDVILQDYSTVLGVPGPDPMVVGGRDEIIYYSIAVDDTGLIFHFYLKTDNGYCQEGQLWYQEEFELICTFKYDDSIGYL